MNPERWRKIEEIFQRAVELPPGERESFLLRAAGDDPALRREVDSLLAAHVESGDFLEDPVVDSGLRRVMPLRGGPEAGRIGPYKLLRALGRGGMSRVYLAVRDDDEYQKLVALKVIRQGMDREDLRRRFRTERQILASLDHPNIAKLLDGGTTSEGLPYFVMDYIEGVALDEFCDRNHLTVPERLQLFRTVCSAVQYAHRNLVVHRDLKTSNILVTPEGIPKLLDFGIAKLLKPEQFPVAVEFTATQMRPMTPYYASPEQIQGKLVTTSSDIYSLGVLLYKLLTSRLPYRLESHTPREVERAVLEQEPEPPSESLVRRGEESSVEQVAAARRASPGQLRRALSGDLDNILLTALRKEPQRRYGSVEQLSEDLRRHLEGLPVQAHKDSLRYRTRKFVRRNRWPITVAAGFVALLIGFAGLMAHQANRIAHERDQAQRERDRAEHVVLFLQEIFQVSDPRREGGETITAREILDRGARRVDQELRSQPQVQATLMEAIGGVYRNLGLYELAEAQLRRALEIRREHLGEDHPETIQSVSNLGVLLSIRGEYADAEPLLGQAFERRLALYGEQHPAVAESLNNLGKNYHGKGDYERAERLYRRAIDIQSQVADDRGPALAEQQTNLGILLSTKGQFEDAEELFRSALETRRQRHGREHPAVADSLNDLAVVLGIQGRYEESEPLFRESLAMRRHLLGADNIDVAESLNNLGRLLRERSDLNGAERLYRESLVIMQNVLGPDHPTVAIQISNLGQLLKDMGELEESEEMFRQSLDIRRRVLGPDHSELGISLSGLGSLLVRKGELANGEAMLREAVEVFTRSLGESHWRTAEAAAFLGECLTAQRRFTEAEPLLVGGYRAIRAALGPDHRRSRGVLERLVGLYQAWGRPQEAARWAELDV